MSLNLGHACFNHLGLSDTYDTFHLGDFFGGRPFSTTCVHSLWRLIPPSFDYSTQYSFLQPLRKLSTHALLSHFTANTTTQSATMDFAPDFDLTRNGLQWRSFLLYHHARFNTFNVSIECNDLVPLYTSIKPQTKEVKAEVMLVLDACNR